MRVWSIVPEDAVRPGQTTPALRSAAQPGMPAEKPEDPGDRAARLALERARQAARDKGLRPAASTRLRRGGFARHQQASDEEIDDGDATAGPTRWHPGPGMGYGISGPGPSRRDPQLLGGIATRLVLQRGWTAEVGVGGVVGRWPEIVGEQIAGHCQVENFDGGALVVRADSTAWATQIRLLLPQLEKRLAEEVGEGTVTQITVLGPGGPSWKRGLRSVPGRGPRDTYG